MLEMATYAPSGPARCPTETVSANMGVIFLLVLVILSVLSGILPQRLRGPGVTAFYVCVFPFGIAVLFAIVQGSPSPANSIKQGIECLLALSAMCLSVTLPVSLLVMQKPLRRSLTHGSGLWFVLGITASIYLLCGLLGSHGSFPFSRLGLTILEFWAGFPFTRFELVVGIVLALFTFLGIALRLGPTIPCMFLGIIAVKLFLVIFVGSSGVAYEIHVAYPAAIQRDITVLLLGVICGAALGLVLDGQRVRAQQDTERDCEQTV